MQSWGVPSCLALLFPHMLGAWATKTFLVWCGRLVLLARRSAAGFTQRGRLVPAIPPAGLPSLGREFDINWTKGEEEKWMVLGTNRAIESDTMTCKHRGGICP